MMIIQVFVFEMQSGMMKYCAMTGIMLKIIFIIVMMMQHSKGKHLNIK